MVYCNLTENKKSNIHPPSIQPYSSMSIYQISNYCRLLGISTQGDRYAMEKRLLHPDKHVSLILLQRTCTRLEIYFSPKLKVQALQKLLSNDPAAKHLIDAAACFKNAAASLPSNSSRDEMTTTELFPSVTPISVKKPIVKRKKQAKRKKKANTKQSLSKKRPKATSISMTSNDSAAFPFLSYAEKAQDLIDNGSTVEAAFFSPIKLEVGSSLTNLFASQVIYTVEDKTTVYSLVLPSILPHLSRTV